MLLTFLKSVYENGKFTGERSRMFRAKSSVLENRSGMLSLAKLIQTLATVCNCPASVLINLKNQIKKKSIVLAKGLITGFARVPNGHNSLTSTLDSYFVYC